MSDRVMTLAGKRVVAIGGSSGIAFAIASTGEKPELPPRTSGFRTVLPGPKQPG